MTGLALEQSDMDMAVTGLNIVDRQEMIDEMHKLSRGLSKWDLVQDLKAIDTASIPVIKAVSLNYSNLIYLLVFIQNVNLDSLRELLSKQAEESESPLTPDSIGTMSSSRSKKPDDKLLPIDITFDDSPPESQQTE